MSKRAEAIVWERSRAKGSNLLTLIKIAEYADDDGRDAWPSVQTLAKWCRLTERGLRVILHRLEQDGEIDIDANTEGRAVQVGKRTFRPEWFLHVRCVCEPEQFAGSTASRRASAPFKEGRPNRKTLPVSGAPASALTGKVFPETGKIAYPKPEKSGFLSFDPRTTDPLVDQVQGAAPPAPCGKLPDEPDDHVAVITTIAHEAIDRLGAQAPLGDLTEHVKRRCATLQIAYSSGVVARSLDSALFQQSRVNAGRGENG